MKKAERRLRQIRKLTSEYSDNEIDEVYESLNDARKATVMPIEQTWSAFEIREDSCRFLLSEKYFIQIRETIIFERSGMDLSGFYLYVTKNEKRSLLGA